MLTQRIIVKNVFFCFRAFNINSSVMWPYSVLSLNKVFMWLFNDINLKYI